MFTLYKNGECNLCTSGVSSAGQWSVSDDTLRMTTIINNEEYTIESLKDGCLTVTGKRGETLVLWSTEEAALQHGDDEPMEDGAHAAAPDLPSPTAPTAYLHILEAQADLFLGTDEQDRVVGLDADGQLRFTLPDGVRFAYQDRFIGNHAILDDGSIIDKDGNVVFRLSDAGMDAFQYGRCMDLGYVVCAKEVNTFDHTGTEYYTVDLATGDIVKCPDRVTGDLVYFGNGYYLNAEAYYRHHGYNGSTLRSHGSMIFNVRSNECYDIEDKTSERFIGGYLDNDAEDGWLDGILFHTRTYYCNMLNGTIKDADIPAGSSLKNFDHLVSSLFGCKDDQGPVVYNMATGAVTPMYDYASYRVLRLLDNGDIFAEVQNAGGGYFLTVLKPDGARSFEPIACDGHIHTENYFGVLADTTYTFYDYSGDPIAQIDSADVVPGDRTVLCRSWSSGRLSLIDLVTGDMNELDICTWEEPLYITGAYAVTPEGTDGSVIVQEQGGVIDPSVL